MSALSMLGRLSSRQVLGLVALACMASVGFALFAQHKLGMQPCPWCVLQRILFLLIALLAGLGALAGRRWATVPTAVLSIPLAGAGIAAALYQHFVAAKTNSCNLTLADRIISGLQLDLHFPEVFEVRSSCADAAVNLIGVPFEFWSALLYAVVIVAALWSLRRPRG